MPKEVRKGLSYLPQDLSLYDSLTALENLIFLRKNSGDTGEAFKNQRELASGGAGTFSKKPGKAVRPVRGNEAPGAFGIGSHASSKHFAFG